MDNQSLWDAISKREADYPQLDQDLEVDVAIIGGGITGVTAANQLLSAGKKVAILEAGRIGGVTTGFSTGNLYIAIQSFYQTVAKKFDFETAKSVALSRKFAIDYIEKNIIDKEIACNFSRRPWFAYTAGNARFSLEKEVELLKKMDLSIEYTSNLPLPLNFKKAIVMENQARFNPLQYVISLANHLYKNGCLIFEKTRVTDLKETDHCILRTEHGNVVAKKVIMATHTPIGINSAQFYTAPYRSYVVSVTLESNEYPEGHFWDIGKTTYTLCTHAVSENYPQLLMVSGSHHKTGQGPATKIHYKEIEHFINSYFKVAKIAYQWSAQHYQSANRIPYIGLASRHSKHTYMATGYWLMV